MVRRANVRGGGGGFQGVTPAMTAPCLTRKTRLEVT